MLPNVYGLDLLKRWRAAGASTPVLVLSARDDTNDKVRALKLGADDYVTKPFWPEELVARVRARLRRPDIRASGGPLRVGRVEIDLDERAVRVDGAPTGELTKVELDVLVALAKRAGSAISRRTLVGTQPFSSSQGGASTHATTQPSTMLVVTRRPTSAPEPIESRLQLMPTFMRAPLALIGSISGMRYHA